ncbi:MAG TPA: hypothetical protein VK774_07040, partial [Solirubrobacteraceae bacterium]|nr:hypothetical protein [Solirubrobacteraceae bacterium]
RPFFEELGRALAGKELVLVAGNHDHALIEPWLARRAEQPEPTPLGLEQLIEPADASPTVERLAAWASPARVRFAYPGIWLREDVYAMHGHYLDCHLTVPTLERLSVGVMSRVMRRPASTFEQVADYEAVTAPMYAWRHAVARDSKTGNALNGIGTVHAWGALSGRSTAAAANGTSSSGGIGRRVAALGSSARTRALVRAFPVAVAALNRAGIGPLRAEISSAELRRAGLRAMGEVAGRLGLNDGYVVFGHTHRAGPLPNDDPEEWGGGSALVHRSSVRLVNVGCWTYDSIFLNAAAGESPYWPGTVALVEDTGPPRLERLLLDRTHDQLAPTRRAHAQP